MSDKTYTYEEMVALCAEAGVLPKTDMLLLYRFLPEEQTQGGIVIPDQAKRDPICGKIVYSGSEFYLPGEVVYFRPYSDYNIPLGIYGDGPLMTFVSVKDVVARRSN